MSGVDLDCLLRRRIHTLLLILHSFMSMACHRRKRCLHLRTVICTSGTASSPPFAMAVSSSTSGGSGPECVNT